MLYLDNICEIKNKNPNSILIIIDANKVSLGWAEAELYSRASGCSLGTIQVPSSGERIKWTVRTKGDLKSIISYFRKYEQKILVVDGSGKAISSENVNRYFAGNQKDNRPKTSAVSTNRSNNKNNIASTKRSSSRNNATNYSKRNKKSGKKKKRTKEVTSSTFEGHVKQRKYKGKTVHNAIPSSVFDLNIRGSHFKKANPVNTSVSTKDAAKRAAEVEKRRKLVDTTLYPNGVRYGDAYRYRKNKKK